MERSEELKQLYAELKAEVKDEVLQQFAEEQKKLDEEAKTKANDPFQLKLDKIKNQGR